MITPNGDGINDGIDLDLSGFATATFKVWSRWGQKLEEITAPRIIWDGRDRLTGDPVPSGTYFWTLSATRANGMVQDASGYLLVVEK
ncbi:MAG: gliding motility-associated C-terminal domain-containing protein [Flavobacteriales bacterium]